MIDLIDGICDYLCEVHVYMYTVYNTDEKLMDIWIYLDIYTYRHIFIQSSIHACIRLFMYLRNIVYKMDTKKL